MRLLIHAMQSAGATAFALFLAQRPDCLALVDVANGFAAPRVAPPVDMVVKVVITTTFPLAAHRRRFRPDRTILWLRDPRDTWASLATKPYRHGNGTIKEKFALLEQRFLHRQDYDAVLYYEDFVRRDPALLAAVNALGWPVTADHYTFRRRHHAVLGDLWRGLPQLWTQMDMVFGNVRGAAVGDHGGTPPRDDTDPSDRLRLLCPRLLAHYLARRPALA